MNEQIEALEAEVARLREQLNRCLKGEALQVRNDLIKETLRTHTDEMLVEPVEDIREYLSRITNDGGTLQAS